MGLGGAGGGGAGGVGISASPAADVSVERQETRAQARAPAGRVCRPTLLAGRTRKWAHHCRGAACARRLVGADAGEGRGGEEGGEGRTSAWESCCSESTGSGTLAACWPVTAAHQAAARNVTCWQPSAQPLATSCPVVGGPGSGQRVCEAREGSDSESAPNGRCQRWRRARDRAEALRTEAWRLPEARPGPGSEARFFAQRRH